MEYTGERFIPGVKGPIAAEHQHRYAVASLYAKGRTVLDVACGEGYGSAFLARAATKVVGVDQSAEAIEHAQKRYSGPDNLDFQEGDIVKLAFLDHSFDMVVCFETIEHVEDPQRALRELRRVLRTDGVLIISTPDRDKYTDELKNRNEFHLRELNREEFFGQLENLFSNILFCGQNSCVASTVVPEGAVSTAPEDCWWLSEDDLSRNAFEWKSPVYLIAICSNAYLDPIPVSILVDAEEGATNSIEKLQAWGNELYLTLDDTRKQATVNYEVLSTRIREVEESLALSNDENTSLRTQLARVQAGGSPSTSPIVGCEGSILSDDENRVDASRVQGQAMFDSATKKFGENSNLLAEQAIKIAEQGVLLEAKAALLNEIYERVHAQNLTIEDQARRIRELTDEIFRKEKIATAQNSELGDLRRDLTSATASHQKSILIMQNIRAENRRLALEGARLSAVTEAVHSENEALRKIRADNLMKLNAQQQSAQAEIERLNGYLHSQMHATLEITSQNQSLKSYIHAVLSSTSWKISAPIRLRRRLSGGGLGILRELLVDIPALPAPVPTVAAPERAASDSNYDDSASVAVSDMQENNPEAIDYSNPAAVYQANIKSIRDSGGFDIEWYAKKYGIDPCDAILHYLTVGDSLGYNPNPIFDGKWYKAVYTDVVSANMNPFVHFVMYGAKEGRDSVDPGKLAPKIVKSEKIWRTGLI